LYNVKVVVVGTVCVTFEIPLGLEWDAAMFCVHVDSVGKGTKVIE